MSDSPLRIESDPHEEGGHLLYLLRNGALVKLGYVHRDGVSAVQSVLDRYDQLEAIVRDLAALDTPFDDLDCHLCGVYRYRTEEREGRLETVEVTIDEHEDDCPWRLAVERTNADTPPQNASDEHHP